MGEVIIIIISINNGVATNWLERMPSTHIARMLFSRGRSLDWEKGV
jgi:hypothetical protein